MGPDTLRLHKHLGSQALIHQPRDEAPNRVKTRNTPRPSPGDGWLRAENYPEAPGRPKQAGGASRDV
ncbi:hypothetical protein JCM10135_10670 [Stetteria hydrogenophila]